MAAPVDPAPATVSAPAVQAAAGSGGSAAASRQRRAGRTVHAVAGAREYHRSDCELLEGAQSEEITKVEAIRQGYLACGVCKP